MYNKNYLSKRPFVVITNRYTPAPGSQTQKKGWAEKSGWVINEEMTVVDRITSKHESYATVIIDVMETKVLRNRLPDLGNDDALRHYMTKYKAQIQQAIGVWMERMAQDKAHQDMMNIPAVAEAVAEVAAEVETSKSAE